MYKVNVSNRYSGLFKLTIVDSQSTGLKIANCCFDTPCLFRSDFTARQVGTALVLDLNNDLCDTKVYVGSELILFCSESTAKLLISIWEDQRMFSDQVSLNIPADNSDFTVMELVYRGTL
ncbi:hypothetical protein [Photobacterium kishitanii]|uniref:Uncharacterized protein n=1 Tax=Photobacterium kishitanii TaxID=318456 RepID=A0A2T3KMN3_9GAMM|nr:hypothetical protein [Photobacterium kishitanii]PSV01015.1 hypothetical protein C9J27_03025 [Photobacterium kishitanii]